MIALPVPFLARRRASSSILVLMTLGVLGNAPAFAQIIPDGGTTTTVTAGAGGAQTVKIAPTNASGISRNTYNSFSVGTAGANLDNNGINASTIVNEVTSDKRSYLNGPIAVLGSSAHVIIANPNGITVDGASFSNTGGVVLSGGKVSYAPSLTSPDFVNAVVSSGSDIVVTGQGLAGAMPSLQLIAQKIKIDGPVTNSSVSPDADININAGNTELTLDSSVMPGTASKPWASARKLDGNSSEILVDVTPNGSLSASKVQIAVNAKGAGVAFAGTGQAALGGFNITADGKVTMKGARIAASNAIKVAARSIDVLNSPTQQTILQGTPSPTPDHPHPTSITLLALDGDINLDGQLLGVTRDPTDPDSKGAVTLAASGNINILSESPDRLAIAFAEDDALSVTAGGDINNDTGRLISNADTTLKAGGAVNNTVDVVGDVQGGKPVTRVVHGPKFFFGLFGGHSSRRTTTYTFGQLRLTNQLGYIVGSDVFIDSASVSNEGEIDANDGVIKIDTGTLVNGGVATGSMSTTRKCNILFCTMTGGSTVSMSGGAIQSQGSLEINASQSIANNGGEIVSYDNMALNSPEITATAFFAPEVVVQPGGMSKLFSGKRGWIVEQPVGGEFQAPIGSITVNTDQPVVLDGGQLLAGTAVINPQGVVVTTPAKPRFVGKPKPIGLFHQAFE